ncbi:hypothetical protein C1645_826145 [Glomus cerebriforme]|uniref:Uncharacterized protein n=1 Tax=Glomus cerebriforme TaxID=658196 RepID=A0A397SXN1_9GLOM|nr:hypothetical protein C1645_826145 [Glomus cerebriforme]
METLENCQCGCRCGCGCGCLKIKQYPQQPNQQSYQFNNQTMHHLTSIEYENQHFDSLQEIININFINEMINAQNNHMINNDFNEMNFDGNVEYRRKNGHNIRAATSGKKCITFNLYCLPHHGNLKPKIPRKVKKLRNVGLVKKLTFSDKDLDYEIKKAVEELFPHLKNRAWRFFHITYFK